MLRRLGSLFGYFNFYTTAFGVVTNGTIRVFRFTQFDIVSTNTLCFKECFDSFGTVFRQFCIGCCIAGSIGVTANDQFFACFTSGNHITNDFFCAVSYIALTGCKVEFSYSIFVSNAG